MIWNLLNKILFLHVNLITCNCAVYPVIFVRNYFSYKRQLKQYQLRAVETEDKREEE